MVICSFKLVWDGQKDSMEFSRGAGGHGRKGSWLCSSQVWSAVVMGVAGAGTDHCKPQATFNSNTHNPELWGASDAIHLPPVEFE